MARLLYEAGQLYNLTMNLSTSLPDRHAHHSELTSFVTRPGLSPATVNELAAHCHVRWSSLFCMNTQLLFKPPQADTYVSRSEELHRNSSDVLPDSALVATYCEGRPVSYAKPSEATAILDELLADWPPAPN